MVASNSTDDNRPLASILCRDRRSFFRELLSSQWKAPGSRFEARLKKAFTSSGVTIETLHRSRANRITLPQIITSWASTGYGSIVLLSEMIKMRLPPSIGRSRLIAAPPLIEAA